MRRAIADNYAEEGEMRKQLLTAIYLTNMDLFLPQFFQKHLIFSYVPIV